VKLVGSFARAQVRALRCFWFVLCLLLAAPLYAQEAEPDPSQDAAESRATSFQAVEGSQKDDVPGGPLLIGAYAFVMVVLVAYVARLGLLQSKTAKELERLTRAIERGGRS
jgi:CcmD family protein